ncbi:sulfate ABC transporter permease subunit CysT [Gluconobacter sp. P1C6_b]|uniref:sulfate ABC transporter permease subunit CysT n=1 Tax=Gluconobacter sp. P1C6_b TaxID=2762619 RepID=UPI001C03BDFF|nr:sulfate ABC transporter permease subunit CysT [Gluconobacter sp. P1C6_b]
MKVPSVTALRSSQNRRHALPGFSLSLGLTLLWTGLLVVLPLTALLLRPWQHGISPMIHALYDARLYAALRISFTCALLAVLIDLPIGLLLAWTLVRYRPPGHRVLDAMIDLPFAIPTAVTGIALATLYGPGGWIGSLSNPWGLKLAFTPAGIVIALTFIGLPFIVRSIEPVLRSFPKDVEEAAFLLGASAWQRFHRILLPTLTPPLLSGAGLAFARGIGEYGSVIFIAGNQPFHTEVAPLLIVMRLQEYNYDGATSIALILLVTALLCLVAVSRLRRSVSSGLVREDGA